jgi:hypothetical protein
MWKGDPPEELIEEICDRLADGESLNYICQTFRCLPEGGPKPSRPLVYRWIEADTCGFADKYARARDWQGESDADDITEIRRKLALGEIDHQQARVMIDACKWTAGRRRPRKYGVPNIALLMDGDDRTITVVNAPED